MGQQCVRGLLGRAGETVYSEIEQSDGVKSGKINRPTTLVDMISRIDGTMTLLDQRAQYMELESVRKRRHALTLRKRGDQRRARLVFLESRHIEHSIETLFGLMANLQTLKYQVQQTRLVADALQTMSEYTAISQQLREMEKKFNVDALMETIREDSERLGDMEQVLTESLLPSEQEEAVDRALADLEEKEAKAVLEETLKRQEEEKEDWDHGKKLAKKKGLLSVAGGNGDGSGSNDMKKSFIESLSRLFNEDHVDDATVSYKTTDRSANKHSSNEEPMLSQ